MQVFFRPHWVVLLPLKHLEESNQVRGLLDSKVVVSTMGRWSQPLHEGGKKVLLPKGRLWAVRWKTERKHLQRLESRKEVR